MNKQRIPGMSLSLWHATAEAQVGSSGVSNKSVDVCVVGAGIAGLTTAYLLQKEGRSVTIVDMGVVGGGETGQTSAHLSPVLGSRYYDVIDARGQENARNIADAHKAAVDTIESIVQKENIECEFLRVDGFLFMGPDDVADNIRKERDAMVSLGMPCELVDSVPGVPFDSRLAIRVHNQGRFHPMKYMVGLASVIRTSGGSIVHGKVTEFKEVDGARLVVLEDGRTIHATDVVVATNSPVNSLVAYHTKQVANRTYVVALRIPIGSVPTQLMWDTAAPYHYIRTAAFSDTEELLLVGGEDHLTGQHNVDETPWVTLEQWARSCFPIAGVVEYRWSGQVMESIDGIGYNGRDDDDHTYVITGDSGNGLTNGTLGARIVTDLILGKENAWAKTFDAKRIPIRSVGEWLAGAGRAIVHLAEHAVKGSAPSCTHLGCVLAWNKAEESWDCPCHGSRYDVRGKVLHGPAITDLKELTEAAEPILTLEH